MQISRTQKPDYQPPAPPPQQQHREIIAQPTKILSDKRHIIKNESISSNQIPLYNDYRANYANAIQFKDHKVLRQTRYSIFVNLISFFKFYYLHDFSVVQQTRNIAIKSTTVNQSTIRWRNS